MIDLRELIFIHDALLDGSWKKTNEITKEILELHNHRIGFKVTQNYLQSVLRPLVEYNAADYTYRLKILRSSSDFDRFQIEEIENYLTPISIFSRGIKTKVEVNQKVTKEALIKAIIAVNTENPKFNLLKKINFKLFDQYDE
jgi:hypothetical protein